MIYKDYNIVPVKTSPSLYEIKFDGSGKVAECLHGFYTSVGLAKSQVDSYLEGRLTKRVKNAQAVDQS